MSPDTSGDQIGQPTDDADRTDPHADDYCVVCKHGPEPGITMHPVSTIENGHVCQYCIDNASKHFTR